MRPINNFRNHRVLKHDEQKSVFVIKHSIRPEIYLSNSEEVNRILPLSIKVTNVGEPYKELVEFNFTTEGEEEYIKIDPNELQDLVNMLRSVGLDLPVPDSLCRYLDSYEDD